MGGHFLNFFFLGLAKKGKGRIIWHFPKNFLRNFIGLPFQPIQGVGGTRGGNSYPIFQDFQGEKEITGRLGKGYFLN